MYESRIPAIEDDCYVLSLIPTPRGKFLLRKQRLFGRKKDAIR